MRPEYKIKKKTKRRTPPVVKFTFIVVLIFAVGFFVFYSIDNPMFFSGLKSKAFSYFTSSENKEKISNLASNNGNQTNKNNIGDNNVGEEQTIGNDFMESSTGEVIEEVKGNGDTESSIIENDIEQEESINKDTNSNKAGRSFWQKIVNFFVRQENKAKNEEAFPDKLTINFYFCSLGEEEKLVLEKRTITAGNTQTAVTNAMQQLLKGPAKSYHFPVIPAGTKLLDIEIYENIAKINLSEEFLEESLDSRILDEYIIYSIVDTITEIPDIEGVIFYIEGKRVKVYGNVDLSIPAIKNERYLEEKQSL